ncbi:SRPBCC family protein [Vitreimonas flagellata]|uniref:SRPBCC family protein n=1 Tax=Vitreimonas flagellata TaxID=2560861 RepID=UPI0010755B9B|nr:SRPBCC family protein [Vitreimonas flagellata]
MEFGRATAPDTFVLERTLKAPIARVWSYFVDGDKRSRWFTGGDTLSANGQAFSILFAHRNITSEKPPERWAQMESGEFPMTGRVLAFDPPRLLAITWGDGEQHVSEVRFEFTAKGEETHLKLTHTKIDTEASLRDFAGGWTAHLETLASVLAGKPANHFWADVVAAHEAYETRL